MRHAEAKKFDVNNFVTARRAPDMLPFTKQIQIACDMTKGAAAGLLGKDSPKFEDNEKTMPELRERIRKTLNYLETLRESDYKAVGPSTVVKLVYPQGKAMKADDFLLARAIPNVYFHVTTAYALLRAGGVELGKMDFLGNLPMFDQ
jgi:hypothetical protein